MKLTYQSLDNKSRKDRVIAANTNSAINLPIFNGYSLFEEPPVCALVIDNHGNFIIENNGRLLDHGQEDYLFDNLPESWRL